MTQGDDVPAPQATSPSSKTSRDYKAWFITALPRDRIVGSRSGKALAGRRLSDIVPASVLRQIRRALVDSSPGETHRVRYQLSVGGVVEWRELVFELRDDESRLEAELFSIPPPMMSGEE